MKFITIYFSPSNPAVKIDSNVMANALSNAIARKYAQQQNQAIQSFLNKFAVSVSHGKNNYVRVRPRAPEYEADLSANEPIIRKTVTNSLERDFRCLPNFQ